MNPLPPNCPICHSQLEITRAYCRACDTALDGHFQPGAFSQLSPDHIAFMITFVRNEGKINRVGEELNLSYPTVRSRLHDLIRALGYDIGEEEESAPDDERRSVLDLLSKGKLSSEEALKRLSTRS
ncbi:MAG: DUF2089 domain-containing protein [Thermoflexales bacterium]|nr:DUF2089 domain-containing protein [Thermoflexales bacterium]